MKYIALFIMLFASVFGADRGRYDFTPEGTIDGMDFGVRTMPAINYTAKPTFVEDFTSHTEFAPPTGQSYGNFTESTITTQYLLEDCEDVWTASTNITCTLDTTNKVVGSGCVQFTVAEAFTTGLIAYEYKNNDSFVDYQYIDLYVYSSIALNAGDLQLVLDDTNLCVSPVNTMDLPAIAAAKWTLVRLTVPTPASNTGTVDYIGIQNTVDLGTNTVIRIDDIRAFSTYPRYGGTAVKCVSTDAAGSVNYLWKNITAVNLIGCDLRLRYYASFREDAEGDRVKASIYFYNDDTYDGSNFGRIQLPLNNGWNEVEIPYAAVAETGTFDRTANIESIAFAAGTTTAGYKIFKTGEFVIWDYVEAVPTGNTKGYVIIQFDDGTVESFDEMAPYAAKYCFPVQIYVMPESVGTTNPTTPRIRYADWDTVKAGTEINVLLGVHGSSAIGVTTTDSGIEAWCRQQKKPFLERGLIRGSDYMALPGGQELSLRDEEALRIMQKYFVSVRGTKAYYQEGPANYKGLASYGYNCTKPKDYVWSYAMGIDANYQTYIDQAIEGKTVLILYAHGLNERSGGYWALTRATYQACIDYIQTKVAEGTLQVVTLEDLINGNL